MSIRVVVEEMSRLIECVWFSNGKSQINNKQKFSLPKMTQNFKKIQPFLKIENKILWEGTRVFWNLSLSHSKQGYYVMRVNPNCE